MNNILEDLPLLENISHIAGRLLQLSLESNERDEIDEIDESDELDELEALDPNTPMGAAWKTIKDLGFLPMKQLVGEIARADDEGNREALINELDSLGRTTPRGSTWQDLKDCFSDTPEAWHALNTPGGWQALNTPEGWQSFKDGVFNSEA